MAKATLIFLIISVAASSVHLLPRKDFTLPNTPENLERLQHLGPDDLAEELSGQFEGDIIMSPDELDELMNDRHGRTGLLNSRYHWTDNTIPYEIRDGIFNKEQINYIHLGVQRIMDVTCLKFVPYDPAVHKNYVYVTSETGGCSSSVGMRGGGQRLNLAPNKLEVGCFRLYTIVHEFLHALGFYHMQSATERNEYVKIAYENLQSGSENNFNTYNASTISQYGTTYDYGSVMHYSKTAFSKNGQDTIIPLKPLNGEIMGQRFRLSDMDIMRINMKYCI